MADIQDLQEEIYGDVFNFPQMDNDTKVEHIELLHELLEKQRVLYARMSLSDDPQAIEMKNQLLKSVEVMGFPNGTDVSILFNGMSQTIEKLKEHIDS